MKRNRNFFVIKAVQILIDAGLIVLSIFISYGLTERTLTLPTRHLEWFLRTIPLFLILKLSVNYLLRIYRQLWRYVSIGDIVNIFKAVSLSSLLCVAAIYFFRWPLLNKAILILDWILCICFFSGARFVRRYLTMKKIEGRRPQIKKKRVLLYGAGESGDLFLRRIQSDPYSKILPVCLVDDDPQNAGGTLHGVNVLGDLGQVESLIGRLAVEEVIITTPLMPKEKVEEIFRIAKKKEIKVKIVPSLNEMMEREIKAPLVREIDVEDLLGRKQAIPNTVFLEKTIRGRRFLVTGGCGSIGKELVRQIARFGPEKVIVLDINETGMFWLDYDFSRILPKEKYALFLCDIRNPEKLRKIIDEEKPEVIYHAAAYKHVSISEANPSEYLLTNVYGTQNVMELAKSRPFIKKFCLISTDKAVNPSNVMGATKRLAEMLVTREALDSNDKKIAFVRFGNVLGSRGSVVPIFKEMIAKGGPVKVTHPYVERYFMDLHEAVHLVLQAPFFVGAGAAFVLDMGRPIKIKDLAQLAIRLSGLDESVIKIEYMGLRPGEKLSEELHDPACETLEKTDFDKILAIKGRMKNPAIDEKQLQDVTEAAQKGDDEKVRRYLKEFFPGLTIH